MSARRTSGIMMATSVISRPIAATNSAVHGHEFLRATGGRRDPQFVKQYSVGKKKPGNALAPRAFYNVVVYQL